MHAARVRRLCAKSGGATVLVQDGTRVVRPPTTIAVDMVPTVLVETVLAITAVDTRTASHPANLRHASTDVRLDGMNGPFSVVPWCGRHWWSASPDATCAVAVHM